MIMKYNLVLLASVIFLFACSERTQPDAADFADAIYTGGKIYTLDDSAPWAEALAVKDGKLVKVGSATDVEKLQGPDTAVIALAGRMVMPGIHDTHMHPVDAGVQQALECSFLSNDLNEVLDILKGCIEKTPPGEWVRGGQWNEGLFRKDETPRETLDKISPDHPVFLMDWSVHNAWVNTRALEKLGITRDTPNPVGGSVRRDPATGVETGILLDNSAYAAQRTLPAYPVDVMADALEQSLKSVAGFGVTTLRDAITTRQTIAAYDMLSTQNRLKVRVKTALSWKSAWAESHESERTLIEGRSKFANERIDTDFAKIMLDGIPPTLTAAMLEPYEPNENFPADHKGELMIPPDELNNDVIELDKAGLTVKIHATGDGSARAALDSFEAARKANGDSGLIHEVSHAELIHADDLPRFKALNVAAEMCPIIWYPIPGLDWKLWIGERLPVWPVKSLLENGALVTYGSDWPVVPTANPWPGIEAMVTRMDPYGQTPGADYPEEAIDLESAIRIFTLNSAIANKAGDSSGALQSGRDADFIVLDRNLFEVPIEDVGQTEVLMTVIGGEVVHGGL